MKKPNRNFGVRLPVSTLEKLRCLAVRDHRSTGSMLRLLTEEYIARFEGENGEILLPGAVDNEKGGE